ncbi:MAG: hypothetical protein KDC75_16330, partial [Phaeodactylibacter sp.]|nr:hypothetical protein [Phaeodactylibacter sp.]
MKSQIMILTGMLFAATLTAQEKVRYTDDFRFARGIYTSLQDLKANDPVKPADIITDIDAS